MPPVPQLAPDARPTRDPDAMFAMLDDTDGVVLQVRNKTYYSLNETAVFILQACDGSRSLAQIAAGLTEAFEVSEDEALAEVLKLVAHLIAEGLVTVPAAS